MSCQLKVLNDGGREIVIQGVIKGSIIVVRKAVKRYPSNRFFTLFHHSVSRFSHKAFLPPFRMTADEKSSSRT
ncbi:MAG: hypothetical protein UGF91_14110 [Dialister invisus]|nr:hypothetical protein [Dialister invisus]